jgi:hypothetical protein
MNIGSYQACLNFVGQDQVPALNNLRDCVAQLSKICGCQKAKKVHKSEECNVLYITFIKTQSDAYINLFRTMTTDEYIVFNHNAHHEIKRIKLR